MPRFKTVYCTVSVHEAPRPSVYIFHHNILIGGPGWNRTNGVSCVPVLQTGVIAN